jgi:KaiC/GvpD/RAD55 family RecA-like ATPase
MSEGAEGRELVFRPNHHSEQVLLAAAMVASEYRRAVVARQPSDRFLVAEHRAIWNALRESVRLGVDADPATLARLVDDLNVPYLAELVQARPALPDAATLSYHEQKLVWDHQRYVALTGPISSLLEAIQEGEEPDRVRGFARATAECFEGWSDRRYLHTTEQLVAELETDLRLRMQGRAVYPFGLLGLDYIDPEPSQASSLMQRRMIPGAAPGNITVVTGTPGSGKSTVTARIVLGLARQRRRVLYGAWEMSSRITLELLATFSLGWSRTMLMTGQYDETHIAAIKERATQIARFVRFMSNPFRRRIGDRPSNERNLDVVAGYIADTGCDVFVGDLWKRCLAKADPDDEEEALYRQQAICEELSIHAILVQQQRLKDIEARADKRPTRDGVKGSGAWVEVADNMIGVHRPALWKPMPDTTIELDILKQRYGKWPLAIEFNWDADRGMIDGGRSIPYEMLGTGNELSSVDAAIMGGKKDRRR